MYRDLFLGHGLRDWFVQVCVEWYVILHSIDLFFGSILVFPCLGLAIKFCNTVWDSLFINFAEEL